MSKEELNDSDDFENDGFDEDHDDLEYRDDSNEFGSADLEEEIPEVESVEPSKEPEEAGFDEIEPSDSMGGMDNDIDSDSLGMSADDELEEELSLLEGEDKKRDSEKEPGFLSTSSGKAVLAASAVMLTIASVGAYSLFFTGQPVPVAQVDQPAAWGTVVVQEVVSPAPVLAQEPAQDPSMSLLPNAEGPVDVAALLAEQSPEEWQTPSPVPVATYAPAPIVVTAPPQPIDLGSFKAEILDAIRSEIPALMPSSSSLNEGQGADLATAVESLRQELAGLRQEKEQLLAIEDNGDPRNGLTRLKGFHVTNSTDDGTMSIVETPSGRVNVYFEGEKFNLDGKTHHVTGIVDGGRVVLVDNGFFIDEIREARPATPARAPQRESVATTTQIPQAAQTPQYSPPSSPQAPVMPDNGVVMTPRSAPGWNLNANMNQGFLVKNPRGEFKMVRQGDVLDGLGVVDGLDSNGFLRVGIYKIARD